MFYKHGISVCSVKNFNWDTIQVRDLAGMSERINLENVGVFETTFFLGGK